MTLSTGRYIVEPLAKRLAISSRLHCIAWSLQIKSNSVDQENPNSWLCGRNYCDEFSRVPARKDNAVMCEYSASPTQKWYKVLIYKPMGRICVDDVIVRSLTRRWAAVARGKWPRKGEEKKQERLVKEKWQLFNGKQKMVGIGPSLETQSKCTTTMVEN